MTTSHLASPVPEQILAARLAASLTQLEAARLVHLGARGSGRWSEYERGIRNIDLARWELFLLLTRLHPTLHITAKVPKREPRGRRDGPTMDS